MATNPYNAPRARVADADNEVGEVKFWSFAGRLGRLRYLAYGFGATLVMMLAIGIITAVAIPMGESGKFLALLIIPLYIVMFVISFMLAIQRAHDFNASGWMSLLILVPLANLVFLFIPGTKGSNNFGAQPPPNTGGVIAMALIMPVVAIIGILAAIAIPAYNGYVQKAKMQQQQGQFKQEDFQKQMEQLQQEQQTQQQK